MEITNETKHNIFKREVSAMLLESASWNDRVLDWYRNVPMKEFLADYIFDGILYDALEPDEDFRVGEYTEYIDDFNLVRDTLWNSGAIIDYYNANRRYDIHNCYDYFTETLTEMCPHCECEVELVTELKYQPCPHCGIMIAPCGLCNTDIVKCSECPLECTKKLFKKEDVNYVILQDNGEVVKWEDNGLPVIYGGLEDAEEDWQEGDTIMTLGKYAKNIGVDWRDLISD